MNNFTDGVTSLKNEGAYKILAAATKLEAEGQNIVHLEIGQPDFDTPAHICEAGIQAIRAGKTQYNNPSGITSLKDEIAKSVSRQRGIKVDHSNVVVGPGAKPGLWFAVQAIVETGDEVLIPDPGFPTYTNMVKAFGGVVTTYTCIDCIDMEEIKSKLTDKTKIIVLNSPSNPTGFVLPKKQLELLANLLSNYPKLWIISDEIYSQLIYSDEAENLSSLTVPYHSIAACPGMLDRTIIVDGFSKTYSMTGWRLGFVVCPTPLAERLHLLLTHALGCTATFTQFAGLEALQNTESSAESLSTMVKEYKKRRDYVVQRCNDIPKVSCVVPQGAFYVFPNVSKTGLSSEKITSLCLNEGGVAILPGTDFGENGEGYVRFSYVANMETLKEGLDRFEKVIRSLSN